MAASAANAQTTLRSAPKYSKPQCSIPHCPNLVYARKVCARHGGKRKCAAPSCDHNATTNAYCIAHGGVLTKKFCIEDGCSKQVQTNRRCLKHGGGRRCKVPGCFQHVRSAGLCHGHHTKVLLADTIVNDDDDEDSLCTYVYKRCTNERALKKDGSLHTLCDFHRNRTNLVQKQYNTKKRKAKERSPTQVLSIGEGIEPTTTTQTNEPKILSMDSSSISFVDAMTSTPSVDELMDLNILMFQDFVDWDSLEQEVAARVP
ncbi:Aste57867_4764 [Aphanomyces stellatus]|uniref:Aste57867_4764 protein n=1 Tax=Aphanomyces stellatus TaxID=120398 RepID=A0A485KCB6_9STRA|nr:hypothetical protein As57867_004751 [Aphanomyces stellatus]VFT81860.1 Aste57867_4764 [Aphanomyces stellatus]